MRFTSIIPNGLSTLNLIFGFLSIISSIDGNFSTAALFIFLSMLADAFDGKIARKVRATSDIGKEFDSLADMVSFGLAGAILIYKYALTDMKFGIIIPILIIVCTALRLARFNIEPSTDYFTGLPSPAFGFFAAAFVVSGLTLPVNYVAFIFTIAGLAMVSMVKYPSFKTMSRKHWAILIITGVILIGISFFEPRFILAPFILYAVGGPIMQLFISKRKLF